MTEPAWRLWWKEEYPSMIPDMRHSWHSSLDVPVKIIYDRTEDMFATTKRHPSIVRHKTGVRRMRTIVALEVDSFSRVVRTTR